MNKVNETEEPIELYSYKTKSGLVLSTPNYQFASMRAEKFWNKRSVFRKKIKKVRKVLDN